MEQIELLEGTYHGFPVLFQPDGFINATQAAKAFGKKPSHFLETEPAKRKIRQVSEKLALEEDQIVISLYGNPSNGGGTWFHPKLAVTFAMWLSDDFAWWCEEQIELILKGDTPVAPIDDKVIYAQFFLEMASINRPRPGFYNILDVSSELMYASIGNGLPFNQHSIALISIGQRFKKYYDDNNLQEWYGTPKKYSQLYPSCFPQSAVVPMVWHYPDASMSVFKFWLTTHYLPTFYPKYLKTKVKQGVISADQEVLLIEAMNDRYVLSSPAA